jgi:hypothetical protein
LRGSWFEASLGKPPSPEITRADPKFKLPPTKNKTKQNKPDGLYALSLGSTSESPGGVVTSQFAGPYPRVSHSIGLQVYEDWNLSF